MNYRPNSTNQATQTDPIIKLEIEIPESLHEALVTFMESHPNWDQPRVMSAALSMFLLQNRTNDKEPRDRAVSRIYLDSLFKRPVG